MNGSTGNQALNRERLRRLRDALLRNSRIRRWGMSGWTMPAPHQVKCAVLSRYGLADAVWIETGTYRGDTTHKLAEIAKHVYSIEPSPYFHELATLNLRGRKNVSLIQGLSEDHLLKILKTIDEPACVFLDGHFSGGMTFRGPCDSPILLELQAIEESLSHLKQLVVFIDDFDCFPQTTNDDSPYPTRQQLVAWAMNFDFHWTVEHNIFILTRRY